MRTPKVLADIGVDPDDPTLENASVIVTARVADLLAWEPHIRDPRQVTQLHQMRIAAKKLRYTMEVFAPFYGAEFAAALSRVKAIQEQLGSIHDADVMVPELAARARAQLRGIRRRGITEGVYSADFDAIGGLIALCRRKQDERKALYRRFIADWRKARAAGFFEALLSGLEDPGPAPAHGKEEQRNGRAKPAGKGQTDSAAA
jgi:hypothetical protein